MIIEAEFVPRCKQWRYEWSLWLWSLRLSLYRGVNNGLMNDCHSYVHNFKYLWKWGVQWLLRPSLYRGVNNEVIKELYNLSNCGRAAWKKAYNIVENFQNKHLWNFVVIFIFTLLSVKLESYFISSVYWAMRWWFHLIVILSSKLCKYRPIETL